VQIVGDEFLSLLDDGTDLASDFEAKRAGEIISRVLESIPEADKKIFVLRYWLGMSIEQIMHQMNCGESRVKVSLHRTRKKIAQELGKRGIIV
jgi:RNA polymerase sigma-70 factor (ECF subfamily)